MVDSLIEEHYNYVKSTLWRFKKSPEWVEDVLQESAIKALTRFESCRDPSKFKSWFTAIAMNTAKNMLRCEKQSPDQYSDSVTYSNTTVEDIVSQQLEITRIIEIIEELPRKQQQAVELRAIDGLSFKDIAEIMNCKYNTAKANYRHGILRVRENYEACD